MVVKRCYICGALGYEELLLTCTECESLFIHQYCMNTVEFSIPDGFSWVCENCEETPKHVASKFTDQGSGVKRTIKLIPADESIALANSKSSLSKGKIHFASPKKPNKRVEIGGIPCKGILKSSNNAGEKRPSGVEETIQRRLSNHPASCATWNGSFKIGGYSSSCNDVWGYPPSKAGRKAYEFSKKMPGVLQFEAIPRSTVWADMFIDRGPDKNDIGLYLFPRGDSSELVSYLEKQDIVLRSSILGVQFLIFSSSHLDEESKKINQAYYLWGLFVPPVITLKEPGKNQFPSETNNEPAIQHIVENKVTAKIPAIGVPIPRGSHRSCSEMSKAAASGGQRASEIQVKPEKYDRDDLASPPKIPARVAWVEPTVPPGFEGLRRF